MSDMSERTGLLVGDEGVRRLSEASVILAGVGAVGSSVWLSVDERSNFIPSCLPEKYADLAAGFFCRTESLEYYCLQPFAQHHRPLFFPKGTRY